MKDDELAKRTIAHTAEEEIRGDMVNETDENVSSNGGRCGFVEKKRAEWKGRETKEKGQRNE